MKKLPEIWGVAEVCQELGTVSSNLDKIPGLPEPDQVLAGGRIWQADRIRKFAQSRREHSHWASKAEAKVDEEPVAA